MSRKSIISSIILASVMMSCNQENEATQNLLKVKENNAKFAEGKQLMENKCYICHNPNLQETQMIAPAMIAVKEAYMTDNEGDFIASFQNWINNPTVENSKMPESIEKYGIMPNQHYDEASINKIAGYIYNNNIEKPSWWNGEETNENPKEKLINAYNELETDLEKGMFMASNTKKALGQNLMGQIQKNGAHAAVEFCNIEALPITDSMATLFNAKISRISDRARNEKNSATKKHQQHIDHYKEIALTGKEPAPLIFEEDGYNFFYYPIETNEMCLTCHGPKDKIEGSLMDKIAKLYPNDKAIGYDINQVRGIWEIKFPLTPK